MSASVLGNEWEYRLRHVTRSGGGGARIAAAALHRVYMADPAAAAAPVSDPAPANFPDAEASAAACAEYRLLFQRKLMEMLEAQSGMNITLLTGSVLNQWESRSAAEWKELYRTRLWKLWKKYRLAVMQASTRSLWSQSTSAFSTTSTSTHAKGGHRRARTFYMAVHNRFGSCVPHLLGDLLCETCPLGVQKLTHKENSAEHKPAIITKGFGACVSRCDLSSVV
eukprot:4936209-Pleurochrysis_carterae.AAC.2